MSVLTPNMNLIQPVIGTDSGLSWEQGVNANSSIIDQHTHASGSGVQITPNGININTDLSFVGNNATTMRSARFSSQVAPIAGGSDLSCVYVSGVDLYYNDGNGVQIRMTSGGLVNATSSGISSGTASASFVSSILTVLSAVNTPAAIRGGSYLMGNTGTTGSNYLTLNPPAAMASNFSLTLPNIPGTISLVSLDTSGNFGNTINATTANPVGVAMTSVGSNAIAASMNSTGANAIAATMTSTGANAIGASMTSTGANAVAASRTRAIGTSVGVGGVAYAASSGLFATTSQSDVLVTNQSVTITTSGRPIFITLIPLAYGDCLIGMVTASGANLGGTSNFSWYVNGSPIVNNELWLTGNFANSTASQVPPGSLNFIYNVGAGTYTIQLFTSVRTAGPTSRVFNSGIVAYEL